MGFIEDEVEAPEPSFPGEDEQDPGLPGQEEQAPSPPGQEEQAPSPPGQDEPTPSPPGQDEPTPSPFGQDDSEIRERQETIAEAPPELPAPGEGESPPIAADQEEAPQASRPTTVTKREIAERIAKKTEQTQVVTKMIIQAFLDEIVDELAQGHKLEFRDFGIFDVVQRKARVGRNPRTGEKVYVPAKRVVSFKMGRLMKERVR